MSAELQTVNAEIISSLVINGDLSKLNPTQKVQVYNNLCERLGLDPLTQPFSLMTMQGKQVLYCNRSGATQLSNLHKVSHKVISRENLDGILVVTARAFTPDGRETESIGAVSIAGLKGNDLANAYMKAETKSKRRATLDLLGLGMTDETEIETINGAQTSNLDSLNEKFKPKQIEQPKPIVQEAEVIQPERIEVTPAVENQLPTNILKKLQTVGTKVYGKEWDSKRKQLVLSVTNNRTDSSKLLTPEEANKLIKGIEAKLPTVTDNDLAEVKDSLSMMTSEENITSWWNTLPPDLQRNKAITALVIARKKELK